jgi:PKD domain
MSKVRFTSLRWAALFLAAAIPLNAAVGTATPASAFTRTSAGAFTRTSAGAFTRTASANQCRHSNQLSTNASIGSQVDGDLVTICLSKSLLRKLAPKPTTRPIPKPVPKVKPIPAAKPTPKPTRVLAAPVKRIPIKVVPRPKPKPKPKNLATSRGNRGVFRTSVDALNVVPTRLKPGGTVALFSAQKIRMGRTKLLGSKVVVRFTPTALSFNLGDGGTQDELAATASFKHIYHSAGTYSVRLTVTYRVEYRLASGKWFSDPDSVQLNAKPVAVLVGNVASMKTMGNIVLVTP